MGGLGTCVVPSATGPPSRSGGEYSGGAGVSATGSGANRCAVTGVSGAAYGGGHRGGVGPTGGGNFGVSGAIVGGGTHAADRHRGRVGGTASGRHEETACCIPFLRMHVLTCNRSPSIIDQLPSSASAADAECADMNCT